jgi:hypothetical protein
MWCSTLWFDNEGASNLASGREFVHGARMTCLGVSPCLWFEEACTYHSLSLSFLQRKDWPQRKVVSIQSSARLTGSFLHSDTRKFAIWELRREVGVGWLLVRQGSRHQSFLDRGPREQATTRPKIGLTQSLARSFTYKQLPSYLNGIVHKLNCYCRHERRQLLIKRHGTFIVFSKTQAARWS